MRLRALSAIGVVSLVLLGLGATGAVAQGVDRAGIDWRFLDMGGNGTTQSDADQDWRIEWYGGWSARSLLTGGNGTLPPPGPEYASLLGLPTRAVPSWYFGDGAAFLTDVVPQVEALIGRDLTNMVPLDPALIESAIARQSGGTVGGRLTRFLGRRYGIEVDVGLSSTPWALSSDALDAIEASRAAFAAFWRTYLAAAPNEVSSTAMIRSGSGHQFRLTGALRINLTTRPDYAPYVVVGGGTGWNGGQPPEVRISGRYQFMSEGGAPFDERDAVRLHFDVAGRSLLAVVGGGLERSVSSRLGLRVDARWYLSPGGATTLLDSDSDRVLVGDPERQFGFTTPTVPSLIHNNRAGGATPPSTLSADDFRGFTTFSNGLRTQFSLTAGMFLRF